MKMRKFTKKIVIVLLLVATPLALINYLMDPATLFHKGYITSVVEHLSHNNTVIITGDMDEAYFQREMISSMATAHETVIVGSSHIMYIPFEYMDYYVAGLSGAFLGDYYALVGLMEYNNVLPEKIIFGVDSWAFDRAYDSGRHSGIKDYAIYEYNTINGMPTNDVIQSNAILNNVEELFSFSYFQSSLRKLLRYGIKKNEVVISENETMEEEKKISPSGRRINATTDIKTYEEIKSDAEQTIAGKTFYQMNDGFSSVKTENLNEFFNLINYLISRGVEVELYLPSYFPALYSYFESHDDYSGIIALEDELRTFGKDRNILIRGSYNPEYGNVSDRDFFDLLHLYGLKGLQNFNTIMKQ